MQFAAFYFNFMSFSFYNVKCTINFNIGFLSYIKRLKYYFTHVMNKLFTFTKGLRNLLEYTIRLFNMLKFGHFIELLTVGLGYKVTLYRARKQLCFDLNYSHRIFYKKPVHLLFRVFKKRFMVFGINKMEVVHAAKKLRDLRSPNIYKGTGIRYKSEKVVLKIGKTR